MDSSGTLSNANPVIHKVKTHQRVPSSTQGDVDGEDPIDALEIYELIKDIKDPEHPNSLEELRVLELGSVALTTPEELAKLQNRTIPPRYTSLRVRFTPTVPHCGMSTLIGLCIRVKLMRTLPKSFHVRVEVTPGSHYQETSVNKQLNDMERVAAALENPNLIRVVNQCLE